MSDLFLPQYRNVEIVLPGARTGKGGNPHHYLINEKKYSRVTTGLNIINKPALIPWAKRVALGKVRAVLEEPIVQKELMEMMDERAWTDSMSLDYNGWVDRLIQTASDAPDEQRDASAALGQEAHALVQQMTTQDKAHVDLIKSVPENQLAAVYGAIGFIEDYKFEVLATELTVWSDDLGIAGTIDGVGRTPTGQLIIWDWKRSAGIYWETALQLAAYSNILEPLVGESISASYAVRLLREPPEEDEPLYEARCLNSG